MSDVVSDYIEGGYYSKEPFSLILFSDEQIRLLSDLIKSGDGNLNLDATGSVNKMVPN